MEIRFKILLQVDVRHEFHAGEPCDDLLPIPAAGDPAWSAGRLLLRIRDGQLLLLGETDAQGALLGEVADSTLWFGLQASQPTFANYTQAPVADGYLPLYRNVVDPAALDVPLAVRQLQTHQRIVAGRPERPLHLRWLELTASGERLLAARELAAEETEAVFATRDWPAGLYRLDQIAGAQTLSSHWVRQPGWGKETLWGMLAITLDPQLLAAATPPTLTLTLAARRERLCYYVLAPDLLAGEFAQLQLLDTASSPLAFERIEAADISLEDPLGRALLSDVSQLALFRSLAELPRLARGYPRLQLRRGNEVLVQHLPQAGLARTQAQFVIHLAKS